MIRAVIIDDEIDAIESLKTMLNEFCEGVEIIGTAQKPLDGIKLINQQKPDLLFLDIEMPGATGFDILEATPEINYKVVFTTAYNHYAIKAIKYGAMDYLMKPIDIDELQETIEEAGKQLKTVSNQEEARNQLLELVKGGDKPLTKIALCVPQGYVFVQIDDIYYLKGEGSYTRFYTSEDEYVVSKNLKNYEELMPESSFARVSNSYLVNIKNVESYFREDGGMLRMKNGEMIGISRSKKNEIKELLGI